MPSAREVSGAPEDHEPSARRTSACCCISRVGAATERVYLSYPRIELREARPRVPSFYGLDVMRAITGRVPSHEELQDAAARETRAALAWPAPETAARAVDDFEHDLAVLGALLATRDPLAVKGRARYLLELNEHLRRSLTERWKRWKPAWTEHDGLVAATDDGEDRARRTAAGDAPVLADRAPALRVVSVPVPAVGDLPARAVRGADAAAAARSADEGRAVPRDPDGVLPRAAGGRRAAAHAREPGREPRGARSRRVAGVRAREGSARARRGSRVARRDRGAPQGPAPLGDAAGGGRRRLAARAVRVELRPAARCRSRSAQRRRSGRRSTAASSCAARSISSNGTPPRARCA